MAMTTGSMNQKVLNYKISSMDSREIIETSEYCWRAWDNAWSENKANMQFTKNFVFTKGSQWQEDGSFVVPNSPYGGVQDDRLSRGKSCYEINVIKPIYRQLYAEQLISDPQGDLVPINNEEEDMPTELIDIIRGRYRYDCYKSRTKDIYASCYQEALNGWSAFYWAVENENPYTFDTVLKCHVVKDAATLFFDPSAKFSTKQDGSVGGFWSATSYRELKCMFPDKEFEQDIGVGVHNMQIERDEVCYCNLWIAEPTTISMVQLEDGRQMQTKEWNKIRKGIEKFNEKNEAKVEKERKKAEELGLPEEVWPQFNPLQLPTVTRRQKQMSRKIYHIIHTKSEVLSKTLLPIKELLPIVFVKGDSINVNGKEQTMALCEDAVQSQRSLNYLHSQIIDNIDKSFGSIIIGHIEAIGDELEEYRRPSISNVLTFKSVDNNPIQDCKPSVVSSSSIDPTMLNLYQMTLTDIYNTLGRSLESFGGQTNAQSGVAIDKRQIAGNMSVGIYSENLNDAIAGGTQTWTEWSPHVYDTERSISVMDEDGQFSKARINYTDGSVDEMDQLKVKNKIAFSITDFAVECVGGTSFAAQRSQSIEAMTNIMQMDPQNLPHYMLDEVMSLLPYAWASRIKRRLRTGYINQNVLAAEKGQQPPPPQPSPEERLAEAQENIAKIQEVGEVRKQQRELQSDVLQFAADTAGDVATVSTAFAKAPTPELAQALEQLQNILKSTMGQVSSAMERPVIAQKNS